jgi:hypothetical protein
MNGPQVSWPLALWTYLGLLALFAVIVYCTYLPIRLVQGPAARKLYVRWLLVLWPLTILVGSLLPTLAVVGALPNRSMTDPAMTAPTVVALVFMAYFPWIFLRGRASPNAAAPGSGPAGFWEKGGRNRPRRGKYR